MCASCPEKARSAQQRAPRRFSSPRATTYRISGSSRKFWEAAAPTFSTGESLERKGIDLESEKLI